MTATDAAVARALAMFSARSPLRNPTMQDKRDAYDAIVGKLPVPEGVQVDAETWAHVPGIRVGQPGASANPSVLLLHGGGYVMGSAGAYASLAGAVAVATGLRVIVPDYRLAPEHTYPAALDDVHAVYQYLVGTGPVAVVGDSAGGGLALGLAQRLRDEDGMPSACAVVISPEVDLTASLIRDSDGDFVSGAVIKRHAELYLDGRDPQATPYASPLHGDQRGLPPVLVQTGDAEAMHDEALELHRRLVAAGTTAVLDVAPGMFHVWPLCWSFLPQAQAAVDRIGAFVLDHVTEQM